jgi:hypothetical protein
MKAAKIMPIEVGPYCYGGNTRIVHRIWHQALTRNLEQELNQELQNIQYRRYAGVYYRAEYEPFNGLTVTLYPALPMDHKKPIRAPYELTLSAFAKDDRLPYAVALLQANPYRFIEKIGTTPTHAYHTYRIPGKAYLSRLNHHKKYYKYSQMVCTHKTMRWDKNGKLIEGKPCKCRTVDQRVLFHPKLTPEKESEAYKDSPSPEEIEYDIYDDERDPGDYGIYNDLLDREQAGDAFEAPYTDYYVNEMPYKCLAKAASQAARPAREGFSPTFPLMGKCTVCGGRLSTGFPEWDDHASKHILQPFNYDDKCCICIDCGTVREIPGKVQRAAPIRRDLIRQTRQKRIELLTEYYKTHPDEYFEAHPNMRSYQIYAELDMPTVHAFEEKTEHSFALKEPLKGLKPERIKLRWIRSVVTAMWSRDEIPENYNKAILNSTILQKKFALKFKEIYNCEISNSDVKRLMNFDSKKLAEKLIAENRKRRYLQAMSGDQLKLNNFIKSI